MTPSPCASLADYLDHDLTGGEWAAFEAHLAGCPNCRQAVEEQRRLAALLQGAARLEPAPAALTDRVRRRVRAVRRRRIAAVAAALVSAAAIWLIVQAVMRPKPPAPPGPIAVPSEPPAPAPSVVGDQVRVTFPAGVLTVPEEFETPNVTFIWVYPGLRETHPTGPGAGEPPSSPERSEP
jgi:anti-sigma factor (TIGR02949 family)